MTLYAVDVYSGSDDSLAVDGNAQITIVKATQGTGYVNPACNHQVEIAKNAGHLIGLYHYAGGGNPASEAQFFIDNIRGYLGEAVLILDWESYQNYSWGNTGWARAFVDKVHDLTGVWPLLYVQESAVWQVANCASDCGLWGAKYASMNWHSWQVPDMGFNTGAFSDLTGWQFAGDDEDRSIFYLDEAGWKRLANPSGDVQASAPAPTQPATPPAPGPATTWVDGLGDTWTAESATFITGEPLNLRWGAKLTSSLIGTLPAGSVVKYDAWSNHDGYVWIRQPRSGGEYGYMVCRDATTSEAFGEFKE